MKQVQLLLTVPQRVTQGEIQINIQSEAGQAFYTSQLPWFEDEKCWRTTMIKALGAVEFNPNSFSSEEQEWMVQQGWLTSKKNHFQPECFKTIGQALYNTLFPPGEGRKILERNLVSQKLHLQIQFSSNIDKRGRLPDYPWELIADERGFLAQRQVTFSRFIAFVENIPKLPAVETINVLLISSDVGDADPGIELPPLNTQEQEAIQRGLEQAKQKGDIVVEVKKGISFKELGDYLIQISAEKAPHVIHFDGHGFFGKRCNQTNCRTIHRSLQAIYCRECNAPLDRSPQGYLLFEPDPDDFERNANYVSATEISTLLRDSNLDLEEKPESGVRLVVLSACKSGTALGSDSVFNGVAQKMLENQISAVVAMQYNVTVKGAKAFAERFYRALGNKKPLTIAVKVGQGAMGWEGNQWYRPVLYFRWQNEGGRLFSTQKAELTTQKVEPKLVSGSSEKSIISQDDISKTNTKKKDIEDYLQQVSECLPLKNSDDDLLAYLRTVLDEKTDNAAFLRQIFGFPEEYKESHSLYELLSSNQPSIKPLLSIFAQRINHLLWRYDVTLKAIPDQWAEQAKEYSDSVSYICHQYLLSRQPTLMDFLGIETVSKSDHDAVLLFFEERLKTVSEPTPDAVLYGVLRAIDYTENNEPLGIDDDTINQLMNEAYNFLYYYLKDLVTNNKRTIQDSSNAWWAVRKGLCYRDQRFLELLSLVADKYNDVTIPSKDHLSGLIAVPEIYKQIRTVSYTLSNIQAIFELDYELDKRLESQLHNIIQLMLRNLLRIPYSKQLYLASVHHEGLRNYLDYIKDQKDKLQIEIND